MRYLKIFEHKKYSLEEIEDLFVYLVENDICTYNGNLHFQTYSFDLMSKYFVDMIEYLNRIKVKFRFYRHPALIDNNQLLFIIDENIISSVNYFFENSRIIPSPRYPNRYKRIWVDKSDNKKVFFAEDLKNLVIFVDYFSVCQILIEKYDLSNADIANLFTLEFQHRLPEFIDRGYVVADGLYDLKSIL